MPRGIPRAKKAKPEAPITMVAKRPRGRPRKNPLPNGTPMERALYTAPSVVSTPIPPPVLPSTTLPGEYWVQLAQVAQGTEVWLRTRKV